MRSLLHSPRSRKRGIGAAAAVVLALVASLLTITPAQAINDTGTGGVFVPASGSLLSTTATSAGTWRNVQVAGVAGLPDDGSVGAVSLNATVSGSPTNGILYARPDTDTSRTMVLVYNGTYGEYTSNTGNVAVGTDGTIQVMTETNAKIILTVQGYYTADDEGTAPGGFVPVDGKRIVDTRSGTGAPQAQLAPGKSVDVQIGGTNGVPANASAAVLNLLAINSTTSDGYFTAYPTGTDRPSNALHYAPSTNTSTQAQVSLSASGKATIYNGSATANLVIDLQGYFTAAGQGGSAFTPGNGRVFDSRSTGSTILAKNETRSVQVAGLAGVPVMGSGLTAVVLTLTASHGGSEGRAVVWPDGATKPGTTSLNFRADEIRTNTVTVALGANGKVSLQNVADPTNYIIDVQGWYGDPQAPKVACPGPYTDGAWVKAKPTSLSCNVTAAPADSSNREVEVITDAGSTYFNRSDTANVTKAVAIDPTAGLHTITAVTTAPDGSNAITEYSFGLGDWAASTLSPFVADGSSTSLTPLLFVMSDDDVIPADAVVNYKVIDRDGTTIATSEATNTGWQVPAGLLQSGEIYSWNATVTAVSGGNVNTTTVTTPTWSISPNSAIADDSPQVAPGSGIGDATSAEDINPNDVQNPSASSASGTAAGPNPGGNGMTTLVTGADGGKKGIKSSLLSASEKVNVRNRGYIRTAFSSVVTVNRASTQASTESESGVFSKTPKNTPKKMALKDVYHAGGVKFSLGISVSGNPGLTITVSDGGATNSAKSTASKSELKKKELQQKVTNIKVNAVLITSFSERTESSVTYGSSTWHSVAGD